jgi:antibiotic biosynthesis monooxygenase (ABM) superfamily enzyme
MSRHELWEAMLQRKQVMLRGFVGLIQSIQMEDGSGYNFNVTMTNRFGTKTVFIRCKPASFIQFSNKVL